ncbi:MAG: baseplate J/gp47 family protein [bacterium]|nr:baseplate J/gp47 family protein [bacterium]
MYLGRIESGKSYKKFYLFFIILSLGLVGAIIYVTFGRATITLMPKKVVFENNFDAAVLENPNLAENAIPGKVLALETEESRLVTTNDVKGFDGKASGTVTIYNKRDKDQPLLAKTRLLSASGILFRTDKRAIVPAGGEIDAAVTADREGKSGNIGPEKFTLVNIWKGWQDKLYGESKTEMTGGYAELPYIYEQTIDQALNILAEQLYAKNLANLQSQISSGEKILADATKNEILAFSSSAKPETQSDKFTIKVKTRTIALICNEEKLKDLAQINLKQAAPKDKEFLNIVWDSFSYKLKSYDLDKKIALLEASLSGESRAKISAALFVKNELVGMDRYGVKKYFEKFEDVGEAEVYFKPFWVRKVPSMLDHFEIQIK